jgi:hypothetical protein
VAAVAAKAGVGSSSSGSSGSSFKASCGTRAALTLLWGMNHSDALQQLGAKWPTQQLALVHDGVQHTRLLWLSEQAGSRSLFNRQAAVAAAAAAVAAALNHV